MERLEETNLLECKIKWLINKTTDEYGRIFIGGDEMLYVISVGTGGFPKDCYVDEIFRNTYNLWYVTIKNRDGTVAKNVNANLVVFYAIS